MKILTTAACTLAVMGGLSALSPAHAIGRSADGTGDAILLPYYSTRDGRSTVFSITNHSAKAKAVRVAIAEGGNGRAALTFNLYLSAHDSWSGAIFGTDIQSRLISNDETCTAPPLPQQGVALRTSAFTGSRADGIAGSSLRLSTGHIEIIEMGEVEGVPAGLIEDRACNDLIVRHTNGPWKTQPNADIARPSGGLSADAQLIDVAAGVAFNQSPVVFTDFSGAPRHDSAPLIVVDSIASEPRATPKLMENWDEVRLTRPTLAAGATSFDIGFGGSVPAERPADAVSALLMAASLEASFILIEGLAAESEMVLTSPTRRAYLDDRPGGLLDAGQAPRKPFDFVDKNAQGAYCTSTQWTAISNSAEVQDESEHLICESVATVHLSTDLVGADNEWSTDGLEQGRILIDLTRDGRTLTYDSGPVAGNGYQYGLPVVAQILSEVRNANAEPGVIASYGIVSDAVRTQDGGVDF